jgi:hypothetical protein
MGLVAIVVGRSASPTLEVLRRLERNANFVPRPTEPDRQTDYCNFFN